MHDFCEANFSPDELVRCKEIHLRLLASKIQKHLHVSFHSQYYYLSAHEEIRLLTLHDDEYPSLLKTIYDPPPLLFWRGKKFELPENTLAIVGTRKASSQSLEFTRSVVKELSAYNFCIVSGLAKGIDRAAHEAALEYGIPTLGISACGIDLTYPAAHAELYSQVMAEGAVISEFPIGMPPAPFHFPRRNRIISGLSKGVLLIEAPEKSGALITARTALEQGREVFVVEWDKWSEATAGNRLLLDQGATAIRSGQDIIDQFRCCPV
jgi:DNA processing protein